MNGHQQHPGESVSQIGRALGEHHEGIHANIQALRREFAEYQRQAAQQIAKLEAKIKVAEEKQNDLKRQLRDFPRSRVSITGQ